MFLFLRNVCHVNPTFTLRRLIFRDVSIAVDRAWGLVAYSPERDRFVALPNTAAAAVTMRSDDGGATWIESATPIARGWGGLCWSSRLGLFIAVSNNLGQPQVMTSPDGITWTTHNSAFDVSWRSVIEAGGQVIAVSTTGTANTVMRSENGQAWGGVGNPPAPRTFVNVVYSPELNRVLAIGESAQTDSFATSDDNGNTWTIRSQPNAIANFACAAWSPQLNLFVALQSGTAPFVSSPDGITWTNRQTLTGAFQAGVWCESIARFLFVDSNNAANNQFFASADGLTFAAQPSPTAHQYQDIAWSQRRGVAVAVAQSGVGNRATRSGIQFTYA